MIPFEKKITSLCSRNGYCITWVQCKFGRKDAKLTFDSYAEFKAAEAVISKLKNIHYRTYTYWPVMFEGIICVTEKTQYENYCKAAEEEQARLNDWWQRYSAATPETKALMACGSIP